ncbi:MAG: hypothetical protein M5U28_26030 [Sandaracinaceae bacterium]|nr:hypothetical protein [Sandaracinaceae bacterium]
MAGPEPREHGHAQIAEAIAEDLADRAAVLARLRAAEGAEGDPGDASEPARVAERGEHAIDAVGRLTHVLEEEDRALERRRVRGCPRGRRGRPGSRRGAALCHAGASASRPVIGSSAAPSATAVQRATCSGSARPSAQTMGPWMERSPARAKRAWSAVRSLKPTRSFFRRAHLLGIEAREQARHAAAPAGGHDCVDARIGEGLFELGEPAGVAAGEEALAREEILAVGDAVARAEALHAALEVFAGEGRGRRDHAHVATFPEGRDGLETGRHART